MSRLRENLTYANVTASVALFIALAGTSYAVTQLPRDSVGRSQLRSKAVGSAELGSASVTSRALRDRSVRLADISASARRSLTGSAGPAGPEGDPGAPALQFHVSMNSAGRIVRGNATGGGSSAGDGAFSVEWAADVSTCSAVATLAFVAGGHIEEPPAGRITVRPSGRGIEVRTFDADGTARDLPFSAAVAC